MSNHSGSYMLNEILKTLLSHSVFESLETEKTQSIVLALLKISNDYDCNPGEILEDIGERLGVCYCCSNAAQDFREGVCLNCYEKYYVED